MILFPPKITHQILYTVDDDLSIGNVIML